LSILMDEIAHRNAFERAQPVPPRKALPIRVRVRAI
jgi:hypothetical protein